MIHLTQGDGPFLPDGKESKHKVAALTPAPGRFRLTRQIPISQERGAQAFLRDFSQELHGRSQDVSRAGT